MPTFEQGDVVRVPFPYTDRDAREHRPALVVSRGTVGESDSLLWVVMITSAANRPWPGDVPLLEAHRECGLPVPSRIRTTKIATIEAGAAGRLGHLPPALLDRVRGVLAEHLGMEDMG
jgi:mRNA interferase MazF